MRPKFQPQGANPNPKAQIPASRNLGLKTGIWTLRLGFWPQDWDLGLETGIWALRLGFEGGDVEGEEGEEGENPPYV